MRVLSLSAVGQCWTVPLIISKKDAMNTKLLVVWNVTQTFTTHLKILKPPSSSDHQKSQEKCAWGDVYGEATDICVCWFQMATRVSLENLSRGLTCHLIWHGMVIVQRVCVGWRTAGSGLVCGTELVFRSALRKKTWLLCKRRFYALLTVMDIS